MTELIQTMLAAIENDLKYQIDSLKNDRNTEMISMMRYHMGWEGENAGPAGKRLRPLFLLLTTQALSSNDRSDDAWRQALPAATAIELIHNFSLVHDDIEDDSATRRGRPTLWKLWGIPQAINTGDAMFAIAHHAMYRLLADHPAETVSTAAEHLLSTCVALTNGQHLDMGYENREDLTVEDYWPMIGGKTAALLSACTQIGAILANAHPSLIERLSEFGRLLGLAFQVQDDILGIWGDEKKTGKSVASDILTRKKSYPILLSLNKHADFYNAWQTAPFQPEQLPELAEILRTDGTYAETAAKSHELTRQALELLEQCELHGEAGELLRGLSHQLLERSV